MITPKEAFYRLLIALAMGLGLGLFYGFLRPLRRRRSAPADLIFMLAAFFAWLQLSFGVCGGDLRLGCLAGLPLGAVIWESTAGKLLRPVFFQFWKIIGFFFRIPMEVSKKY